MKNIFPYPIPKPKFLPKGTPTSSHYHLNHLSICAYFQRVYGVGFISRFHEYIEKGLIKAVCLDDRGFPIWDVMQVSIWLDDLLFDLIEKDRPYTPDEFYYEDILKYDF